MKLERPSILKRNSARSFGEYIVAGRGTQMLYTLGKLSLSDTHFTRLKPLVLLSYLSLEGRQSRKHLAQLFWPEAKDPFGDLSVALSRLRKARPGSIESDQYSVTSTLPTDALAFSKAAEQGQRKTALGLYQGPFLENVALPDWSVTLETWVYTTRETFAAQAQACLLKLAERYAEESRIDLAAQYAETAYTLPAAPAPEAETLTLIFDLLQEGGHEAAQAVAAEAEELGLTLVKAASPRTRTNEAVSHNLPPSKNAFVGRQEEIETLSRQLSDPNCRLLTLMGPGGIGKSRLALNVAHAQLSQPHFKDGVYLASLESLASADLIPTRIAEALELFPKGQESHLDLIRSYIGRKPMLLILDNMEHLLGGVSTVSALLASCPNLKLLVTSRARLNLEEEWVFRVGGLSYPSVNTDDLLAYDAPKLFVERAKQSRLDLALTQDEYEALVRLCDLTGGSPLALEFAAAWLSTVPLNEVVREVEQGIEVLKATYPVRDRRHQSMEGVFAQSWQRLVAADQAALRKLSVFEGGFTREAALEVAGVGLEQLMRLISTSFVALERDGRYGFHPLTKQYLEQQCRKGAKDYQAVKNRRARYFLSLAEEAELKLKGEEQKDWLERLDSELNNLRATLRWCIAQKEADIALRLAGALSDFWTVRGYYKEGSNWLVQVLALTGNTHDRNRVKALYAASILARGQGEPATARTYLKTSLVLSEGLESNEFTARIFMGLGTVNAQLGNYSNARIYYKKGLAVSKNLSDPYYTAAILNNLGIVEERQGNYSAALAFHKQSLTLARDLGDQLGVAASLQNLGVLEHKQSNFSAAYAYYKESLEISENLNYTNSIAISLNSLGKLEKETGNFDAARNYYKRSLVFSKRSGECEGIAITLSNLGEVALEQKDYVSALSYLKESLKISSESNFKRVIIMGLENLASLSCAVEKFVVTVYYWASVDMLRQEIREPFDPYKERLCERDISIARQNLDNETFEAAWEAGQKLTFEEAVAYALS